MPHITNQKSPSLTHQNLSIQHLEAPNLHSFKAITTLTQSKFPIFLVLNEEDNQYYVIKAFPLEDDSKPHPLLINTLRFNDIDHQNIIGMYGCVNEPIKCFQNTGFTLFLMEYAPNGTIEDILRAVVTHPLHEAIVRSYFRQLITAIEFLHNNKVYHLDLKLENLMIGKNFEIKLIDFDTSAKRNDLMIVSQGSQDFRAPELIKKVAKKLDVLDIYSAGIILFAMYTGCMPYIEGQNIDNQNLFHSMIKDRQKFWKYHKKHLIAAHQPAFVELFDKMTAEKPTDRIDIEGIKKSAFYNQEYLEDDVLKQAMEEIFAMESSEFSSVE